MNDSALVERYRLHPVSEPATVTPLSLPSLTQMVEQNHEQAEAAHARLRTDLDKSEEKWEQRFATLAGAQAEMRLALIKAATPDISSLRMSPATLIAILAVLGSLAGGYLTIRDSISELRKSQQLQELKLNELQNSVLDVLRRTK